MVYPAVPPPMTGPMDSTGPTGDVKLAVIYRRWSWRLRRCDITGKRIWGPAWMTVEYVDQVIDNVFGSSFRVRRVRINRWLSNEGRTFWLLKR